MSVWPLITSDIHFTWIMAFEGGGWTGLRGMRTGWLYITIKPHVLGAKSRQLFTASGDAWLNKFFDQIVHKFGATRLNFFLYLQSQFWECSQVLVMRDECQIGSVHEVLWCVMWTIGRNGTVVGFWRPIIWQWHENEIVSWASPWSV